MFQITYKMVKINYDIDEECIKNKGGVLAVNEEYKRLLGKLTIKSF